MNPHKVRTIEGMVHTFCIYLIQHTVHIYITVTTVNFIFIFWDAAFCFAGED
jgi:hypothetical protein